MIKKILVLFILITLTTSVSAWQWKIPKEKYKAMDTFQRAQYNKGVRLCDNRQYRAAASEFEKFSVNFEDSPVLPYIIFLQGYCLHSAKDRNKAIKTYNKVLDFFGEDVYAAAPSLFYLGKAHFNNGDIKKGMLAMKEMAEDVDYRKHPLTAGALRSLADNYWKNKNKDMAIKYWKQIINDFATVNPEEAKHAIARVTAFYVKDGKFSEYEKWYMTTKTKKSKEKNHGIKTQRDAAGNAFWAILHGSPTWFTSFQKKEKEKCLKTFWSYFQKKKPIYEKLDNNWGYYSLAVLYLSRCYNDKKALKQVVNNALQYISTIKKDQSKNDDKYVALIKSLREGRQFDLAQHVINKMTDRKRALWEEYYILSNKYDWKRAIVKLVDIEKRGSDKDRINSQWQQGYLYQHRLRQYDKAIKIYRDLAQPPKTLWEIQSCYFKKGNITETLKVLSEIEGSFPKDAPEAAFRKACCYKSAKQNKKAVAAARKVLKKYPKSQAASKAHQLLEDFGVATGGGVINND